MKNFKTIKNMKPFDLEQAKNGAKLCTRDGREARLFCFDFTSERYPLLGSIMNAEGGEDTFTFTEAGTYCHAANEHANDLFMVEEETKPTFSGFDLEAAKAGAKLTTRNGRKAKIISFDIKNDDYPLAVVTTHNDGTESLDSYRSDGRYCDDLQFDELDLLIVDEEVKPFNLEAAKAGVPVCTREGYNARIVAFDMKNEKYPIVAIVADKSGKETQESYTNEGKYSAARESPSDLFMK